MPFIVSYDSNFHSFPMFSNISKESPTCVMLVFLKFRRIGLGLCKLSSSPLFSKLLPYTSLAFAYGQILKLHTNGIDQ